MTIDKQTGGVVGTPLVANGNGNIIYDNDGAPLYLLTSTTAFENGGLVAKNVTFTPLAGQPGGPIVFPDNATALVLSPDGTLGYVISNVAGSDESFIQVIDLENGGIVATSSNVPGHAGVSLGPGFSTEAVGTAVFDAAGKGYLTTWIRMPTARTRPRCPAFPGSNRRR